jgi:hypothetical protein
MNSIDTNKFTLSRNGNQVYLRFDGTDDDIPVRLLLVAPLSESRQIISIIHAKKKQEMVLVKTPEMLDEASRTVLQDEIKRRYFLPKIEKINDVSIHLGDYYWDVLTDRGPRKFLLRSPAINMRWVNKKRIILCDTDGISYDLDEFHALDKSSRILLERIL